MNKDSVRDITELLRLVECMHDDFCARNFGDAEKWIRHISNHVKDFEDKYGETPWGYMCVEGGGLS